PRGGGGGGFTARDRDARGLHLLGRRIGGQEALVKRERRRAVTGQPRRLRLREEDLPARIDGVCRLERANGAPVVAGPVERHGFVVAGLRLRLHRRLRRARAAGDEEDDQSENTHALREYRASSGWSPPRIDSSPGLCDGGGVGGGRRFSG